MRGLGLESCVASASAFVMGVHIPVVKLPGIEASDVAETRRDRPTVLIVDDEPLIVDTLMEILEGAGFLVLPAYDGSTALEKAAHRRPDF